MRSARTEIALLVSLLDEDEIEVYNDLIIALPTSKK